MRPSRRSTRPVCRRSLRRWPRSSASSDAPVSEWLSRASPGFDHDTLAKKRRLRRVMPSTALRVRGALRLGSQTRNETSCTAPAKARCENKAVSGLEMTVRRQRKHDAKAEESRGLEMTAIDARKVGVDAKAALMFASQPPHRDAIDLGATRLQAGNKPK